MLDEQRRAVLERVVELADTAVLADRVVEVRTAAGVPLGVLDQAHRIDPQLIERADLSTIRSKLSGRTRRIQGEVQVRDRGALVDKDLRADARTVAV